MAFRILICVIVAYLALWYARNGGVIRQEVNSTEAEACEAKVETSDDILSYTKNCLRFPEKAMNCVHQFIQKREKDPFPIAVECTPNMPETLKEILRTLLGVMNNRTDIESRCKLENSKECENQLLGINEKHDKVMDRYKNLREKLNGQAKEANEKFTQFVLKVAMSRFQK